MTSDSPNKTTGKTSKGPDPRQRVTRRVAWEQKPDTEGKLGFPPLPLVRLGTAWFGILLAAACFPIVVAAIATIFSWLVYGQGGPSGNEIPMVLFLLLLSFTIGLAYGAFMSIPAYLLTQVLNWSLKGFVSERGMNGIFGGLTGFLCVSYGGFILAYGMPPFQNLGEWLLFAFFPITAIGMGHAGAILAGYRRRYHGFPFFEPVFSFEKQFSISYLMKLTLIVAVLAAIFKAAGPVAMNVGFTWLAYLLVQTLLLVGDHWIVRWLSRRSLSN